MNNRELLDLENQSRGWVSYGLRNIRVERMLPDLMQIETTSICNLRCVFCPYDELTRDKKHMDIGEFSNFIQNQCGHISKVGLHHFGEPFLNRDLEKYITICSGMGIETTVSTNATKAVPEQIQAVFQAGLTRLIISLDGTEAEEYEKLRVGAKYDVVMKNIQTMLQCKRSLGHGPFIQIQFIETPENVGKWDAFRKQWETNPEVNQVVLRAERTHGGQRVRHGDYETREGARLPCRYLWESLVVLVDGSVVPCCKDFDGKMILGNIFHGDTLETIWNGDTMTEMRRKHTSGRFSEISLCAHCNEWPGHDAMTAIESLQAFTQFRAKKLEDRGNKLHRRTFE